MPRHTYYDEDGQSLKEECPRCGDVYLAEHDDRRHCGNCGYTEWK